MKVTFNDYERVDLNNNDKGTYNGNDKPDMAYNNNYFQTLMNDQRYDEALDYIKQFHFYDPEKDLAFKNNIKIIENNAKKTSAFYSNIGNPDHLQQIQFIDGVFIPGSFDNKKESNKYVKRFNGLKDALIEGYVKGTDTRETASTIAIDFAPKKQTGIFGWDWIAWDNEYDVDAFYAQSGLNEAQLRSNGVKIEKVDGHTTLKFNKDNSLANQILYNVHASNNFNKIKGYNEDGKEIIDNKPLLTRNRITQLQSLINDTQKTKNTYFSNMGALDSRTYSSTVGPLITDNLGTLNREFNEGYINQSQYNSMLTQKDKRILNTLRQIDLSQYEVWSNMNNKDVNDKTFEPIQNIDRGKLNSLIAQAKDSELIIGSLISHGQVGALITILPRRTQDKNLDKKSSPDDFAATREYQIFVPGLFTQEVQEAINRDTNIRAIQEVNSMIDYGYSYKINDNTEVYADRNGTFWANGVPVDRSRVINAINKNMIINDAKDNLKFKFTNVYNQLYDTEGFENAVKFLAVNAANSIYPDIRLTDDDGNPLKFTGTKEEIQATVDYIFSKKGIGSTLNWEELQHTNPIVARKYADLYDIYDRIIKDAYKNR